MDITPPNILNILNDRKNNITYRVLAYRSLTNEELLFQVRNYLKQKKNKKQKPGAVITIHSIIGHDE